MRATKRFDWLLLACVVVMVSVGIAFIWSSTHWTTERASVAGQQLRWLGISMIALLIVMSFDYMRLAGLAWPAYVLVIILLVLVQLIGVERNYSKRWIALPGMMLQPSEFAKIAVILALARYLMYRKNLRRTLGLVLPLAVTVAPMFLILIQPDLGTALVLVPVFIAMVYTAGARPKHLLALTAAGLAMAPVMWIFVMGGAQRARITAFLWPQADPYGAGWHIRQSLAAIGAGSVTGEGFSSGSPILLNRGFAAETDFIFAVIGHEWGFIGALVVILLFFLFFSRGVEIAAKTREPFGRLIVVGVLALFAFQTLVNLGMTVRLCPITGVTLPFFSYGGSSLLTSFIMIGLVLNVGMRRKSVVAPEDF